MIRNLKTIDYDEVERTKHTNKKLNKLTIHKSLQKLNLNDVMMDFDATSLYPSAMWDEKSVYPKIEIGTEKYRDFAVSLNYGDDDYPHGYGQIKESFKALTKDVILQPYLSDNEFRSTNEDNGIGFNSYIFGIQYPKTLVSAHSIKVEFKVSGNVSAGNYGYALVLTNKLVSISTDGQRHFDLIKVEGCHNIFIFIPFYLCLFQ